MDLESIADEVYGLRPTEFTAARDRHARAARRAGDRELADRVRALRRPTLAAWASNLLVRSEPDAAARLTRLGEELRRALRELDGAQLRALLDRQRRLVAALADRAGRLADAAGHPVGEQTRREVERTLLAVLADEDAARRWAAGRLDRPLSPPSDLGGVGLSASGPPAPKRAVQRTTERTTKRAAGRTTDRTTGRPVRQDRTTGDGDQARRRRAERARRELDRARRAAAQAEAQLRDRQERRTDAERRRAETERASAEAERRVAEARDLLERAERDRDAAAADRDRAGRRLHEAERAADRAGRRARDAAATVRRLAEDVDPSAR